VKGEESKVAMEELLSQQERGRGAGEESLREEGEGEGETKEVCKIILCISVHAYYSSADGVSTIIRHQQNSIHYNTWVVHKGHKVIQQNCQPQVS